MSTESVADLLERAEQARLAGDYRGGCDLAARAAERAREQGDDAGRAAALRTLANQLLRIGAQERAVTACRDAVALLEGRGDDAAICDVLTVEAMCLNELGLHEEALDALARGRDIAQRLKRQDLLYWVHNRTGVVHGGLGRHDLSITYLLTALQMADGLDAEARFCVLNNLGDSAVHQVTHLRAEGDDDAAGDLLRAALGHIDAALALAREAGNPYRMAMSLDIYGMLRGLAGDFAEADRMIEEARAVAVDHGYHSIEMYTLRHLARVRLMRGRHAEAIEGLRDALERSAASGETPMAMAIHKDLSEAYESMKDLGPALAHYKAYHALERSAHSDAAAVRARMAVHQFELDNARLEAELARVRSAELERATLSWQRQATEDALTGLPNRRLAEQRLPEMAAAGPLCVAVADIDHFKDVNDRFGHHAGDAVLQRIAAALKASVRDSDLVARMGGEEFLIALRTIDPADAEARCEVLRARVAALTWPELAPGHTVTISIGVAAVGPDADLAAATQRADENLYQAKRAGRNRVSAAVCSPDPAP